MKLRKATIIDAPLLWFWRNDLLTRKMSINSDVISWQDHRCWLSAVLADENILLLVCEKGGEPIGTSRLDLIGPDTARISINLSPIHRGKGFGSELLSSLCRFAREHLLLKEVKADIKRNNYTSIKCFENFGFKLNKTLTKI